MLMMDAHCTSEDKSYIDEDSKFREVKELCETQAIQLKRVCCLEEKQPKNLIKVS